MSDTQTAGTTSTVDSTQHRRRLRLRAVFAEWWWLVVVLGVLAVLGGGWLLYTGVIAPGTMTQTETVGAIEYTGSFEHQATVAADNEVYPIGTTLSNQPSYYTTITPTLEGSYTVAHESTNIERQELTVTVERVIRSTADETVLWEQREQLASEQTTETGAELAVPFEVDVPATQGRVNEIQESLGASIGETELLVEATVTVSGERGDRTTTAETVQTLMIQPNGETYSVQTGETDQVSDTARITRTTTVTPAPSSIELAGIPILLLFGIGLIVVPITARGRGNVSLGDQEQAWLAYQRDRAEFEEWITTIDRPTTPTNSQRGQAASLGDLVDFAIDTEHAVIHDPTTETYLVAAEEMAYVYEPPPEPEPQPILAVVGLVSGSPSTSDAESTTTEDMEWDFDEQSPDKTED